VTSPDDHVIIATMTEKRRPGRPREARVDAAVAEATLAELTEKGPVAATIEAIAARAGVGRATVYRRWPNKDALFRFLTTQHIDGPEPADTGDLRKDLLSVFEPIVEQLRDGQPIAVLMPTFVAQAAHDADVRAFVASMVAERKAGTVKALERARQRGELRPGVDLETVADMIAGAFSHRLLLHGEPVTSGYVHRVLDQAIAGIAKK
jgi:AcrR family transcriptional regulator